MNANNRFFFFVAETRQDKTIALLHTCVRHVITSIYRQFSASTTTCFTFRNIIFSISFSFVFTERENDILFHHKWWFSVAMWNNQRMKIPFKRNDDERREWKWLLFLVRKMELVVDSRNRKFNSFHFRFHFLILLA